MTFLDKTDLDVGPHLEEQHGVDDSDPGGTVHADVVWLDINHHDGDGEHQEQVGHVEEHPQSPGQNVLGYQLLLEQDQEDGDICVQGEVEGGELALKIQIYLLKIHFSCSSPDCGPNERGESPSSQSG